MEKSFLIREATINDVKRIAEFNQNMALETEGKSLPDHLIVPGVSAILNNPVKGKYYVAEIEGELAGQLMITYEWSDWRNSDIWWIQSVYVDPKYRKMGIYSALHDAVCHDARERNVKTLRLYVEKENKLAQGVYKKLGMDETIYLLYEVTL